MSILQLVLSVLIYNKIINVESTGYYNVIGYSSNIAAASEDCNVAGRYLTSAHNQQQINQLQQLCQVFYSDCWFIVPNITKKMLFDLSVNSLSYGLQRKPYVG